jgi:hypothetical protein
VLCKYGAHNPDVLLVVVQVARDNLVALGTCVGKLTHTGKFRLTIGALDILAQYAKHKVGCARSIPRWEPSIMHPDMLDCGLLPRRLHMQHQGPRHIMLSTALLAIATVVCTSLQQDVDKLAQNLAGHPAALMRAVAQR